MSAKIESKSSFSVTCFDIRLSYWIGLPACGGRGSGRADFTNGDGVKLS